MHDFDNDLLGEIKLQDIVVASQGKRFLNYIIDVIFFYLIAVGIVVIYIIINPQFYDNLNDDSLSSNLFDRLLSLFIYGTVMGVIEGFTKGKTLGKLLTNTKAINIDGSAIDFKTGFFRGLCRAVPFNAFSALGKPCNPWHDRWTYTLVIDVKASTLKV